MERSASTHLRRTDSVVGFLYLAGRASVPAGPPPSRASTAAVAVYPSDFTTKVEVASEPIKVIVRRVR